MTDTARCRKCPVDLPRVRFSTRGVGGSDPDGPGPGAHRAGPTQSRHGVLHRRPRGRPGRGAPRGRLAGAPAPLLPAGAETGLAPTPAPGPDELPDYVLPPALFPPQGYVAAMQWRMAAGGFDMPRPATAWSRPRYPLLRGTTTPSISRLLLTAATANGLSSVLDLTRFLYDQRGRVGRATQTLLVAPRAAADASRPAPNSS